MGLGLGLGLGFGLANLTLTLHLTWGDGRLTLTLTLTWGDDGVGAEHESEEHVGLALLEGDHEGVPALTEADGLIDEMLRHVKGGGQR